MWVFLQHPSLGETSVKVLQGHPSYLIRQEARPTADAVACAECHSIVPQPQQSTGNRVALSGALTQPLPRCQSHGCLLLSLSLSRSEWTPQNHRQGRSRPISGHRSPAVKLLLPSGVMGACAPGWLCGSPKKRQDRPHCPPCVSEGSVSWWKAGRIDEMLHQ